MDDVAARIKTVVRMTAERGDLPPLGEDPRRSYRLGIMGGTFDPIHNGHLVTAEQAFGDLALDVVVFMPAGHPAFKQDAQVSPGADRYAMTLLATSDNPHFMASHFEVDREGITYTADTLERLRAIYPDNVRIYFITGADAVTDIVTWRDAASPYNFDVIYLEVPALAISSSYLRRRVAASQSLRYLTPDVVTGYIHKHKLYGVRSSHEGAQGGTSHD